MHKAAPYEPIKDTQVNVVLHADDLGMNQSTISAFARLFSQEKVLSASLMAPCPWFPAAVKLQQRYPHADLGLHLTLNSEWEGYRWGPISQIKPECGLVDKSGVYFHRSRDIVCIKANVDCAEKEMRAQIELALTLGFKPTHLDSHMFTCVQPKFLPSMLKLALEYNIPAVVSYDLLATLEPAQCEHWTDQLKKAGAPIFDRIIGIRIDQDDENPSAKLERYLSKIPPGLSYVYTHPTLSSSELDAMTPQAEMRVAEFDALAHCDITGLVSQNRLRVCTFAELF